MGGGKFGAEDKSSSLTSFNKSEATTWRNMTGLSFSCPQPKMMRDATTIPVMDPANTLRYCREGRASQALAMAPPQAAIIKTTHSHRRK